MKINLYEANSPKDAVIKTCIGCCANPKPERTYDDYKPVFPLRERGYLTAIVEYCLECVGLPGEPRKANLERVKACHGGNLGRGGKCLYCSFRTGKNLNHKRYISEAEKERLRDQLKEIHRRRSLTVSNVV